MPVIRVEKNRNYTTMCNYHLQDRQLSLKAKGLLSLILSLPDNWNYSINGLASICKESRDGVNSVLKELERHGYLRRVQIRGEQGKFKDVEYVIYEMPHPGSPNLNLPHTDNPVTVKPDKAAPDTVNPTQISTKEINTKILSTKGARGARSPCGKYKNVFLTEEELTAFTKEYPADYLRRIDRLSEYMESSGRVYKNHYMTLCQWASQDEEKRGKGRKFENYECGEDESL